jgi:hypothetical protein
MVSKNQLLVLFGCIPLRIFLVWVSTIIPEEYQTIFGVLLLMISLSFLYLFFKDGRLNAAESGTGTTWWSNLRLIHGALYLVAAIYALQHLKIVWIPLTIDILFGIVVFFSHYFLNII